VDGAEVCVFEKSDQVSFCGLLECKNGSGLESKVGFEFLSDFSDESLERQFSQKEVSGFLVFSDFSQGNCTRSESVGFLNSASGWGGFTGGF
jgi:hypothetical protein